MCMCMCMCVVYGHLARLHLCLLSGIECLVEVRPRLAQSYSGCTVGADGEDVCSSSNEDKWGAVA